MENAASRRARARLIPATVSDVDKWRRLGQRVRQDRGRMGLKTQQQLADRAGLSRRIVSDIERGAKTSYTPDTLAAVEAALGWAPGSVAHVLAGRAPGYEADPGLSHLVAMWPDMDDQGRRVLLAVAEVLSRG